MVWFKYQQTRRRELFPKLRYDVYDNAASPQANFFMPFKKAYHGENAPPPPSPAGGLLKTSTRPRLHRLLLLHILRAYV